MRDLSLTQVWLDEQSPAQPQELFVLVDAAMDRKLPQQLQRAGYPSAALLEHLGSGVAERGPQLFHIYSASALQDIAALRYAASSAFTVICASVGLPELHSHLKSFKQVHLEGGLELGFAFWDPAILGTLVGQADDTTLHIAGPVLDAQQMQAFLHPITAWWYWDREDLPHRIDPPSKAAPHDSAQVIQALRLTQAQEDLLVEASVPDQIIYHIELNQPHLFDKRLPAINRYRFVRAVLGPARQLGLSGLRDLVNFTAMCLIYRQRMQTDPAIAVLLDQVRLGELTLDQAIEQMPE